MNFNYTTEENLPAPLFFSDFEKAFGIIEWTFIQTTVLLAEDLLFFVVH